MKREDLPFVTKDDFEKYGRHWFLSEFKYERFELTTPPRDVWNALDILDVPDFYIDVPNKLYVVIREEFLPTMLLHEYACRCAEWALPLVKCTDQRAIEAINVKRRWMDGKATERELRVAEFRFTDTLNRYSLFAMDVEGLVSSATRLDAAGAAQLSCLFASSIVEEYARKPSWFARKILRKESANFPVGQKGAEHEYLLNMLRNLINEWSD